MLAKLWTRRCRGCDDRSPHTHHLTWYGRFVFRGGSK
jgi:hypothetical protein